MNKCLHTELSSHEETRCQFNGSTGAIKLATGRVRPLADLGLIRQLPDQDFYVVVKQEGGSNPKPAQRFEGASQWGRLPRVRVYACWLIDWLGCRFVLMRSNPFFRTLV